MFLRISTVLLILVSITVRAQNGIVIPPIQGPVQLIVTPDANGPVEFLNAMAQARSTIELTMYHLTNETAIHALVAAHQRGVDVRVILDGASLGQAPYQTGFNELAQAGVQVKASSRAFSITHEKTMIVDGQLALITAINLTNYTDTTRDFGVELTDPKIISEVEEIFEADWQNADDQGAVTPAIDDPNLVISPVNSEQRLTSLIDSALFAVDVTVENLGDPAIQTALTNAVARGVTVRLITPMCDKNKNPLWNYPFLQSLSAGGVQARVMPYPATPNEPYMHSKMILVDGIAAYVGSVNFSVNSTQRARELGILLADGQIASQISAIFEQDWALSVGLPQTLPNFCPQLD